MVGSPVWFGVLLGSAENFREFRKYIEKVPELRLPCPAQALFPSFSLSRRERNRPVSFLLSRLYVFEGLKLDRTSAPGGALDKFPIQCS